MVNQYNIGVDDYREASDSVGDDSDDNDSDDSFSDDYRPRRSHHHWEGKYDFISAHITYNCHFNLIWRLPYMSLTCGGGVFLVIVLVLTMVWGLPVLIFESSVGQVTREK